MNNKLYNYDKILLIDLLYMGDLIFATPFFRQLRKNYPKNRIDLIVNSDFYDLINDLPYFNHVYSYNKEWTIKESFQFAKQLKKNNYDLGINVHGNWRTILLMYLIDVDYNIGYGGDGKGLFLDKVIKEDNKNIHMVKKYLEFLEKMGVQRFEDESLELKLNNKAKKSMHKFLNNNFSDTNLSKKLIAINTGGTWETKRWPREKFAKLADKIKESGEEVIFIGGPTDVERVNYIIEMMENKDVINAAGKTNLKELMALVKNCDLVISNDSGPVHVAAAMGTPTITIFGPSNEYKFRPFGYKHSVVKNDISCRPCGKHECPLKHHKCMKDIEVADILEKVDI